MYRTVNDLRLLRFALHLEESFEKYEEYLRDLIPEEAVRARLGGIFDEGPAHRRLHEAHAELEQRAKPAEMSTKELLQTLLDMEEAARAFYADNSEKLSTASLVRLFQEMAAEERGHAEAVRSAMKGYEAAPSP